MHLTTTFRPSFLGSFSRAQVASLVATLLDYATLFLCVEVFHFWYVVATALGAFLGAASNFWLNRHWSFKATQKPWSHQARRYVLVSAGSLILNTAGVFLVTELAKVHYIVSVVFVSILVGFLFNYPLHRHYVYRQ